MYAYEKSEFQIFIPRENNERDLKSFNQCRNAEIEQCVKILKKSIGDRKIINNQIDINPKFGKSEIIEIDGIQVLLWTQIFTRVKNDEILEQYNCTVIMCFESIREELIEYKKTQTIKSFINILRNDPEYYRAFKDNIAVCFQDECSQNSIHGNIHTISNKAANKFLELLTK